MVFRVMYQNGFLFIHFQQRLVVIFKHFYFQLIGKTLLFCPAPQQKNPQRKKPCIPKKYLAFSAMSCYPELRQ